MQYLNFNFMLCCIIIKLNLVSWFTSCKYSFKYYCTYTSKMPANIAWKCPWRIFCLLFQSLWESHCITTALLYKFRFIMSKSHFLLNEANFNSIYSLNFTFQWIFLMCLHCNSTKHLFSMGDGIWIEFTVLFLFHFAYFIKDLME